MGLSAGNVSLLSKSFMLSVESAPCSTVSQGTWCQKAFPFAGMVGNGETHLTTAPSTDHS